LATTIAPPAAADAGAEAAAEAGAAEAGACETGATEAGACEATDGDEPELLQPATSATTSSGANARVLKRIGDDLPWMPIGSSNAGWSDGRRYVSATLAGFGMAGDLKQEVATNRVVEAWSPPVPDALASVSSLECTKRRASQGRDAATDPARGRPWTARVDRPPVVKALTSTAVRRAASDRWPWVVAIALALAILLLPVLSDTTTMHRYRGLTYPTVELLVLAGAGPGWLLTDWLASRRWSRWFLGGLVGLILCGGWIAASRLATHHHLGLVSPQAVDVLVLGAAAGSAVRGGRRRSRDPVVLVALAAVVTWVVYDLGEVTHLPMRDLHTYLAAARNMLSGHSAYLQGVLTTRPDADNSPFVYPPFTLPLFEILAQLPLPVVELGWLVLSGIAVLIGLRLIGIRGRWIVVLVAWPVLAVGLSVGNVFGFGFLCFALGYRFAGALVVGAAFKLQSGIPAVWGLRERRYKEIAMGVALIGLMVVATIPLTGWDMWREWTLALGYFEETLDRYPTLRAVSLSQYLPTPLVLLVGVGAIGWALLRGGRNGLARFGLASIVASPTLYAHGFSVLLPGAMALQADILWFVFAIVPWTAWLLPFPAAWLAVAIVAVALVRRSGDELSTPAAMSEAATDLHPGGVNGQVWPAVTPPVRSDSEPS